MLIKNSRIDMELINNSEVIKVNSPEVLSTMAEALENSKIFFQQGEFDQAQDLLMKIINEDAENIDAIFLLANIYHMKGKIGFAIKGFQKVLQLKPSHTDAAISLSVIYNDIGKYEEARLIFEKANENVKRNQDKVSFTDPHINKKFAMKHLELAEMYLSYNRYDEALFEFEKTVKLDPENLDFRVRVAKVYAKKGFISKAFDELKKLKNENPNFLAARIALGVLYFGHGNIIEAQNEWEKILVKDPFNQEAKSYLNMAKTATETSINSN
jgi:tetratricopeptide (TPR) repeat protein